jgi:hypothetical protein
VLSPYAWCIARWWWYTPLGDPTITRGIKHQIRDLRLFTTSSQFDGELNFRVMQSSLGALIDESVTIIREVAAEF